MKQGCGYRDQLKPNEYEAVAFFASHYCRPQTENKENEARQHK